MKPTTAAAPPFPYAGPEDLRGPILAALSRVIDPEVAMTIVDVGLVYGVEVGERAVRVRLTMTSAACPVADVIVDDVWHELSHVVPPSFDIDVELVWGMKLLFGAVFYLPLALLHVWIPVHLGLRALAPWGGVAASLATHALTVGVLGGLIVGMMTRTARGHTGRPIRADRWDVAIYVLVLAAAPVRVVVPWAMPGLTLHAVGCAAVLWSAGFGLFTLRYWPVLTRPRLDGRPG